MQADILLSTVCLSYVNLIQKKEENNMTKLTFWMQKQVFSRTRLHTNPQEVLMTSKKIANLVKLFLAIALSFLLISPLATQASAQSAPLAGGRNINKKVLVVIYNPMVQFIKGTAYDPSADVQPFLDFVKDVHPDIFTHPTQDWNLTTPPKKSLVSQYQDWLNTLTSGRISYTIVATQDRRDLATRANGFDFDDEAPAYTGFLSCLNTRVYTLPEYKNADGTETNLCNELADYSLIEAETQFCSKINNSIIDEVWLFGDPYGGFYETAVNGPHSNKLRGATMNVGDCNKLVPIMGFSYGAPFANMVHDFGHRAEYTMGNVYRDTDIGEYSATPSGDPSNNWELFHSGKTSTNHTDYSRTLNYFGCGNIHYAPGVVTPTGNGEYTGTATRNVCEDFANYPNLTPAASQQRVLDSVWGGNDLGHYTRWFTYFPKFQGVNLSGFHADGLLNDWWEYFMNPNYIDHPPVKKDLFRAEYYPGKDLDNGGTTVPAFVRYESSINYDWADGRPDTVLSHISQISNDNFSIRWTGTFNFPETGTYAVNAQADDGIRAWIDFNADGDFNDSGEQIINDWSDSPSLKNIHQTFDVSSTGDKRIKVEYYENTGNAIIQFNIPNGVVCPRPGPITSTPVITDIEDCLVPGYFAAFYYNKPETIKNIQDIDFSTASPVYYDVTSEINYDWRLSSPDPRYVNSNNFAARYRGKVQFDQGEYLFSSEELDGIRVYLDDNSTPIIDQWEGNPSPTGFAYYTFEHAGEHIVTVEYYEVRRKAAISLTWTKICDPAPDEFCVNYFNNKTLAGAPVVSATEAVQKLATGYGIDKLWTGSPTDGVNANRFSVLWEGNMEFENREYLFTSEANDGMKLFIDGELLIDNWSGGLVSQPMAMTKGTHRVRVEYFDNSGDAKAKFFWNTAPQITNIDDAPKFTTNSAPYKYQIKATDLEGDTLTYSLSSAPAGMTIDSSGVITWTGTANTATLVTVQVSDGELTDTKSYTIHGYSVNFMDPFTSPVSVGSSGTDSFGITATSTNTTSVTVYSVTIIDGDMDVFTISDDQCTGKKLAPGQSCRVYLTFTPKTQGTRVVVVQLQSNSSPSTLIIGEVAEGIEPNSP